MLAYFPTPYPDELLFSVLSRLADTMDYPRHADLSRAIYGRSKLKIPLDFPICLEALIAALPPGHSLTVDQLIDEHTLLPFHQPFLAAKRAKKLREVMAGDNGAGIYNYAGTLAGPVPTPKYLRFCYDCVRQDREDYGQCYWHRVHQLPGVLVCPRHGRWLQDSQVPFYHRPAQYFYLSAERALAQVQPPSTDLRPDLHPALGRIAQDAAWLLAHPAPEITPASLSTRFHRVLAEKGLATYNDRVHTLKFVQAFKSHYASELLTLLDCPVNYNNTMAWPMGVLKAVGKNAKHPLHYLLVIHFLGYTVETFFALPTEPAYFGAGPWPCLNPTCQSYRQAVIETCQIDYANSRLRGTFTCACGFVYRRIGPDVRAADRFRIDRVVAYGPVWEARFQQLRDDPSISLTEIARQLNVSRKKVRTHGRDRQTRFRQEYREQWLAALAQSPGVLLSELANEPPLKQIYHWLLRHDRDWYEAHRPDPRQDSRPREPSKPTQPESYWVNRDVQMAEAVRLAALNLLKSPGRPVQVTQTAICSQLGQRSFLHNPEKFRLTRAVLNVVVEPYETYAIRRLEWAAASYREQGRHPTRAALETVLKVAAIGQGVVKVNV